MPVNELHSCGYDSIGCEPCTRPVLPNQQEREGRWWWEDEAAKECGLHSGNLSSASGDEESKQDNDLWQGGAGELLCSWVQRCCCPPACSSMHESLQPSWPSWNLCILLRHCDASAWSDRCSECLLGRGGLAAYFPLGLALPLGSPAMCTAGALARRALTSCSPHLPNSCAVAALDKQQLSALLEGPRDKDTFVALYAPWCRFCKVSGWLGCANVSVKCEECAGVRAQRAWLQPLQPQQPLAHSGLCRCARLRRSIPHPS